MKHEEYWTKRAAILENAQTKKNVNYFDGELERIYQKAINDTEKDIAKWYTRYATENGISMTEAKKMLSGRELKEFKWTVEEYIKYGKENAVSGEWMTQLENASARYHISRLESLKLQMQNHVEVLMGNEVDGITDLMREHLEDGYYKTAFDVHKFLGVGTSFSQLDTDQIERILSKPWTSDGTNFSNRIWKNHRTELINDLHTKLSQAIIMGENPKVLAKGFAKYVSDEAATSFKSKKSRAENLIMTETAFFRTEGQKRSYKELGVSEFENCATLDSKTSEQCRDMDGTHFPVSEMKAGVNAPPFHNRCRTATCPYFNDEFTVDELRAARNKQDEGYELIPSDMKYREWYSTYVDKSALNQKVIKFEKEEKSLLDRKINLESEKTKLLKRQENLKTYEYVDVDGNKITPADYDETKINVQRFDIENKIKTLDDDGIDAIFRRCGKDNISEISYELERKMSLKMKQKYDMKYSKLKTFEGDSDALKAYIKQQTSLYRSDLQKVLNELDDFELQGIAYKNLSKKISDIDNEILDIGDNLKNIREKLMKAKGIDLDKMQEEIDDLVSQIKKLDKPVDLSELRSRKVYGSVTGDMLIDTPSFYKKWIKDYEDAGKPSIGDFEKKYDAYKSFFKDLDEIQNNSINKIKLDKLQKLLKNKQDELEKTIKRFDITPKTVIVPRTKSAKILDDLQKFAESNYNKYENSISSMARIMGMTTDEVRVELSKALTKIIDECDIGMRIRVSNLEKVLDDNDGGFKNLFEVGHSGGCSNFSTRGNGEKRVFGYSKAVPTGTDIGDRPVYGMMIPNLKTARTNEAIDYINNGPGSWYGDGVTVVINKNKVFNNTSFTLGDSLDYDSYVCGSTFDNPQYNGAFYDFYSSINRMLDKSKNGNEKLITTFDRSDQYFEIQIHGKDNHSADIIEKVYFEQNAFDRAKQAGIIDKLDSKKIPYEILK